MYLQLLINDMGNVSKSSIAAFRQAQAQPAGPGRTLLLGMAAYRCANCTHNSFAEHTPAASQGTHNSLTKAFQESALSKGVWPEIAGTIAVQAWMSIQL